MHAKFRATAENHSEFAEEGRNKGESEEFEATEY